MSITPQPGIVSIVTTGGQAVTAIGPNPNGGIIVNPYSAADQGGLAAAEPLFIDVVNPASTQGNGTTFALQPGQSWSVIPGQSTVTSVNAATSGHKFSVVSW